MSKEISKINQQFNAQAESIEALTLDEMNKAPMREAEPQTKLSQRQLDSAKQIFLKPHIAFMDKNKFNEDYRKEYNFMKETVNFIAENNEVKGEIIKMWTHRFAGTPYEYWEVPVNVPVFGPRYLAEQITSAKYHTFKSEDKTIHTESGMTYVGQMTTENIVKRLDAQPVIPRKSVFLSSFEGAKN